MIKNAADVLLTANPGTLPNMQSAMGNYFQPLVFTQIQKKVGDTFTLVEQTVKTNFMGVRQPLTGQQLQMKPEGQRQWKWERIHAYPDLVLGVDDQIMFGSVQYRVTDKFDFTEYGYVEYHIVQDYQASP